MATTPPLQTSVQIPPTPLHGAKYDGHRPRTRYTSSRTLRALETPPPNPEELSHIVTLPDLKKASRLRSGAHTYSPPSSTQTSPRKPTKKGRMSAQNTGANTDITSSSEASPNKSNRNAAKKPSTQQESSNPPTTMLPTPAKTPRKKAVHPAAINNAARVLFPVRPDSIEDAMPTPRKRRNKRHVGFSLYSSMEDEEDASSEGKIQIYTDSKEKVPELDPTEDNPFYEPPEQHAPPPEPSKGRRSKKRRTTPSAKDRQEIKDAFNREEGMVYVFRGKKIFRKFPEEGDDANDEDDSDLESNSLRSLTRSSIKPRLLFPTPKQRQEREAANLDDEEAPTDIEDVDNDTRMTDPETEQITTPVKQTAFSPATPPTTSHATRSSTKRAPEPVEAIPYKGKKVSPFDGWARTKSAGAVAVEGGKGKKREAEGMEKAGGGRGHKKMKGSDIT